MADAELLKQPATFADPFPVYDELRDQSPLQVGSRSWILLSYDHVKAALSDPQRFSSDVRASDNAVFRNSPLVFDDPPRHTRLRRLVAKAFTPRRVADAEPWVRALAVELWTALEKAEAGEGAPADFVSGYAEILPVHVIAHLLGVPSEQHRQFRKWSNDRAFVTYKSRGPRTPELLAAEAGCLAQDEFFAEITRARRANPTNDLVSALVTAEVDGERLDDADVVGTCSVLLSAGNLTTTRLLGSLVARLVAEPQWFGHLDAHRDQRDAFVEEMLRLESPVQTPIRRTLVDVELGGRIIAAGAFVTIGIGAANNDPASYATPRAFLPDARGGEPTHLAFGHGIHYCVGAALARLEARLSLDVLLERYSRVEPAGGVEADVAGLGHRGLRCLPVRLVPRVASARGAQRPPMS
jgi:cytochrome P450